MLKNICGRHIKSNVCGTSVRKRVISIEISLFAHATEAPEKIERAFQNLLPSNRVEEVVLRKRTLKGEYGNPIIYYKAKITKPEITEAVLRKIGHNLSQYEKELLDRELKRRLEKGSLYLRLDKQAAYLGKYKLCNADPIHLRIRFRTSKIDSIRDICKELGMLL